MKRRSLHLRINDRYLTVTKRQYDLIPVDLVGLARSCQEFWCWRWGSWSASWAADPDPSQTGPAWEVEDWDQGNRSCELVSRFCSETAKAKKGFLLDILNTNYFCAIKTQDNSFSFSIKTKLIKDQYLQHTWTWVRIPASHKTQKVAKLATKPHQKNIYFKVRKVYSANLIFADSRRPFLASRFNTRDGTLSLQLLPVGRLQLLLQGLGVCEAFVVLGDDSTFGRRPSKIPDEDVALRGAGDELTLCLLRVQLRVGAVVGKLQTERKQPICYNLSDR